MIASDPEQLARSLKSAIKRIALLEDAAIASALREAAAWDAVREIGRILKRFAYLSSDPSDMLMVGPGNKLRPLPIGETTETAPGIWTLTLSLLTPEEKEEILRVQSAAATIRLDMADRKAAEIKKAKEKAERAAEREGYGIFTRRPGGQGPGGL